MMVLIKVIGYMLISNCRVGSKHVFVFECLFEYFSYVWLYLNWKSQTCMYLYLIVGQYFKHPCMHVCNVRVSVLVCISS